MWEIDITFQIWGFLVSVILGSVFCILYDFFRALRKSFYFSDFLVFLQDIVYFIICGFTVFLFLLALTNGCLRVYVFFGIAVGFYITRITLSFLFVKLFCFIILIFKKIYNLIYSFFAKFSADFASFGRLFCERVAQFFKKVKISIKKA